MLEYCQAENLDNVRGIGACRFPKEIEGSGAPVGNRMFSRDQLNVSFNGMKWEPGGPIPLHYEE